MDTSAVQGVVFDLYGTLLEVGSLEQRCAGVVADPAAFVSLWRTKQLEYSWLRAIMGRHTEFQRVTRDALDYTAARLAQPLDSAQFDRLMQGWSEVRPYTEVVEALDRLRGLTLAVLSNGDLEMLEHCIRYAGLEGVFEHVLSVSAQRTFKPAPAVYTLAQQSLNLPLERMIFVSSNAWDAAGAKSFGLPVCWINRAGVPMERLGLEPDYEARDLNGLVQILMR